MFATLAFTLGSVLTICSDGSFTDLDYEAAVERANREQKLLLVDFTATWCPPCKRMDKDTWSDPVVQAWIAQNAIAIQVDVDEEPELSRKLEIEAMPTVLAIRAGEIFDRAVGYQAPGTFIPWAYGILEGKRPSDDLLERSAALMESEDVRARYDLAGKLARAKHYPEALEQYLWVWPASREEPGYGGVRLSFMLGEMWSLARAYEPARVAFLKLLDDLQARVDAAPVPSFQDWQEWTGLAQHFEQGQRIIAWYESRRDEHGTLFGNAAASFQESMIIDEIFDTLLQAKRFGDAARLYDDGRIRAHKLVENYEEMLSAFERMDEDMRAQMGEDMRAEMEQHRRQRLAQQLARLYAVLLLAEREEEAGEVAGLLLEALDGSEGRLALVEAGLRIDGQARPQYATWLDEAARAGGNVRTLRKRLERAGTSAITDDDSDR